MKRYLNLLLRIVTGAYVAGVTVIVLGLLAPAEATTMHRFSAGTAPVYIRSIQEDLKAYGFYKGPVSGQMSPTLMSAIRDYQKAAGIKVTGIADMEVVNQLNFGAPVAAPAARSSKPEPSKWIIKAQSMLMSLGHYNAAVDGLSGPATIAAVRAFERSTGMPETGKITPELFVALSKSVVPIPTTTVKPTRIQMDGGSSPSAGADAAETSSSAQDLPLAPTPTPRPGERSQPTGSSPSPASGGGTNEAAAPVTPVLPPSQSAARELPPMAPPAPPAPASSASPATGEGQISERSLKIYSDSLRK